MRFLSADWHRGALSDDECERVESAFAEDRRAFIASATGALRQLASEPSLHDARIVSAVVAHPTQSVVLRLIAGDQLRGFFERTITYSGVAYDSLDIATLARIARDEQSELLADELLEVAAGRYSHALLFWPEYREVVIRFSSVSVVDVQRDTRARPPTKDRFTEATANAV